MEKENESQTQAQLTSSTSTEHDAIISAIHLLESALASPTTGREQAWLGRVGVELAPVVKAVAQHCHLAESQEGLVAEVEASLGRPRALVVVSREHQTLAAEATDFLESLSRETDVSVIRDRAAKFTAGLRAHQAHEADLIYEAFFRDLGVGD